VEALDITCVPDTTGSVHVIPEMGTAGTAVTLAVCEEPL